METVVSPHLTTTTPKRKKRKGEYVCDCTAYPFPHRLFGGYCKGNQFVSQYWDEHWGSGHCRTCPAYNTIDYNSCDVVEGGETPRVCRALSDFVLRNGIKVTGF